MVKLLSTIMDRSCCSLIQVCVCVCVCVVCVCKYECVVYMKQLPLRRHYEIDMRVKNLLFFLLIKSEILDYFSLSSLLHSNFSNNFFLPSLYFVKVSGGAYTSYHTHIMYTGLLGDCLDIYLTELSCQYCFNVFINDWRLTRFDCSAKVKNNPWNYT